VCGGMCGHVGSSRYRGHASGRGTPHSPVVSGRRPGVWSAVICVPHCSLAAPPPTLGLNLRPLPRTLPWASQKAPPRFSRFVHTGQVLATQSDCAIQRPLQDLLRSGLWELGRWPSLEAQCVLPPQGQGWLMPGSQQPVTPRHPKGSPVPFLRAALNTCWTMKLGWRSLRYRTRWAAGGEGTEKGPPAPCVLSKDTGPCLR
jgi:hypothetical protein